MGNACYSVIKFNMRLMRSFGTWTFQVLKKQVKRWAVVGV